MKDYDRRLSAILNPRDGAVIEEAIRRGATRRDLLKMLMAGGATLGLAGSTIGSARRALAATPKRGGSIRFAWAQHGPSDTFDPILGNNSIDYARTRLTYNNLCRFNEDLSVRPERSVASSRLLREARGSAHPFRSDRPNGEGF